MIVRLGGLIKQVNNVKAQGAQGNYIPLLNQINDLQNRVHQQIVSLMHPSEPQTLQEHLLRTFCANVSFDKDVCIAKRAEESVKAYEKALGKIRPLTQQIQVWHQAELLTPHAILYQARQIDSHFTEEQALELYRVAKRELPDDLAKLPVAQPVNETTNLQGAETSRGEILNKPIQQTLSLEDVNDLEWHAIVEQYNLSEIEQVELIKLINAEGSKTFAQPWSINMLNYIVPTAEAGLKDKIGKKIIKVAGERLTQLASRIRKKNVSTDVIEKAEETAKKQALEKLASTTREVGMKKFFERPTKFIGNNVKMKKDYLDANVGKLTRGVSELPGGDKAARELFRTLSKGKTVEELNGLLSTKHIEVRYRPTSESKSPVIEIKDWVNKTYEKIHFN